MIKCWIQEVLSFSWRKPRAFGVAGRMLKIQFRKANESDRDYLLEASEWCQRSRKLLGGGGRTRVIPLRISF